MSFPSITTLFYILVDLAWYTAKYYFFSGSWSDVSRQYSKLNDWFGDLIDWVIYRVNSAKQSLTDWSNEWFAYLQTLINQAKSIATTAYNWVVGSGAILANWYNSVYSKVNRLVDIIWSWLDWFFVNPVNAFNYYLGGYLSAIKLWFQNPLARLEYYLSLAWSWVKWFYADPVNAFNYYLGGFLALIKWWFAAPYNAIAYYLGTAWAWLRALWQAPFSTITGILGAAWNWLTSMFGLNPAGLFAFVRDAMVYWYNFWSTYRSQLSAFMADPTTWVLLKIRDKFLEWLEDLIAENW